MMVKKLLGISSAAAVLLMGGAVFAAAPPHLHHMHLAANLLSPSQIEYQSPSMAMPAAHDPPGGALTAQPEGILTIVPTAGGYNAVWNWTNPSPGLVVGQEAVLVGDAGPSVSLSGPPPQETTIFATVVSPGTVTFFIPANEYFATTQNPETFEAFALFASTPVGQMPEVPYAAGLPLAALAGVAGLFFWHRRRNSV